MKTGGSAMNAKKIISVAFISVALTMLLLLLTGTSFADTLEVTYVEPGVGDIPRDEAIERAKAVLREKFDGMDGSLNDAPFEAVFGYYIYEVNEEPIWKVDFGFAIVYLLNDGKLLAYQPPGSEPYGPDDDELTGVTFAESGQHDISEQEAVEIAKRSIQELGDFQKRIDKLTTKAHFMYGDRYNGGAEPVWLIYFYQDDVLQQKMLLGFDGSFICTASGDKMFDYTDTPWRPEELYGIDGFLETLRELNWNFSNWSLEEKAAFTQKWKPIIDEYIETNPYLANRNPLAYYATRHVYGIPGPDDIPQETARGIAQEVALGLGANPESIQYRQYNFNYAVTDPAQPIWNVFLYSAEPLHIKREMEDFLANVVNDFSAIPKEIMDAYDEFMAQENNANGYRVLIDARTGAIVDVHVVDSYTRDYSEF